MTDLLPSEDDSRTDESQTGENSPIPDQPQVRDPDRFTGHRVRLQIFEGPLDLLLYLIRGHRYDIFDIPIAAVTAQFIEFLETMNELEQAADISIEYAGDFCVTAATLMQIKSRMLLPKDESANEDEDEEDGADPRRELVERLLEYQRMQEAAQTLEELREERSLLLSRPPMPPELSVSDEAAALLAESTLQDDAASLLQDVSTFDLLRALNRVLRKMQERPVALVRRETFSVSERTRQVASRLKSGQAHSFDMLCEDCESRLEIVITFLVVLELVRRGRAQIRQRTLFDEIWIEEKERTVPSV